MVSSADIVARLRKTFRLSSSFSPHLPNFLAIAIGIALSLLSFYIIRNWERSRTRGEIERHARNSAAAIQRGIDRNTDLVQSIAGLFSASFQVERAEFSAFVKGAFGAHNDIQALEWVPRVRDLERASIEEAAQREGLKGFRITERRGDGGIEKVGWRKEYFPVYYLEPKKGNEATLGLDLGSDPAISSALKRAREKRVVVSSPWINLGQESNGKEGFLVIHPIYKDIGPLETFMGFAVGVFRLGDLLEGSLKGLDNKGLDIYLYDESADVEKRVLYQIEDSGDQLTKHPFSSEKAGEVLSASNWKETLDLPGRRWTVLFHPSTPFFSAVKTSRHWEVLFGGLMLTALLGAYLVTSSRRAAELARANEDLAMEITGKIQAQEELQKAYETLKRAQASAIAAEKLAALGRLTAGVSHEILNPLFGISAMLQGMLRSPDTPEDVVDELKDIMEQAQRIGKIAQNLLSFSRQRRPERKPIDLNKTVQKTLSLLEHDLKMKNVAVELKLTEGLPHIFADMDQMQQVIINLVSNARDAMSKGGRIVLSTDSINEGFDKSIELRVSDNGMGIDPEKVDKIFEPFFTTKAEGEGTGLGLAICHGIIEAHGGTIRAENNIDGGTSFIIQLSVEEE